MGRRRVPCKRWRGAVPQVRVAVRHAGSRGCKRWPHECWASLRRAWVGSPHTVPAHRKVHACRVVCGLAACSRRTSRACGGTRHVVLHVGRGTPRPAADPHCPCRDLQAWLLVRQFRPPVYATRLRAAKAAGLPAPSFLSGPHAGDWVRRAAVCTHPPRQEHSWGVHGGGRGVKALRGAWLPVRLQLSRHAPALLHAFHACTPSIHAPPPSNCDFQCAAPRRLHL